MVDIYLFSFSPSRRLIEKTFLCKIQSTFEKILFLIYDAVVCFLKIYEFLITCEFSVFWIYNFIDKFLDFLLKYFFCHNSLCVTKFVVDCVSRFSYGSVGVIDIDRAGNYVINFYAINISGFSEMFLWSEEYTYACLGWIWCWFIMCYSNKKSLGSWALHIGERLTYP